MKTIDTKTIKKTINKLEKILYPFGILYTSKGFIYEYNRGRFYTKLLVPFPLEGGSEDESIEDMASRIIYQMLYKATIFGMEIEKKFG